MKNSVLLITAVVSVLIAAVAITILPDQIPAHFGLDGSADRIGSKYEVLIYSGIVIACAVMGILLRRKYERAQAVNAGDKAGAHSAGNAKIVVIVCVALGIVMIGLEIVFICIGYNGLTQISGTEAELYCSVTVILMGLLFAVLGNIMPKMKKNMLMGLRTTWSMKNDEVWARCQRMGGTVMFFGGAATILSGIILRGYPSLVAMMIIDLVMFAIMIKGSHQIYTDWEKENGRENG